MHDFIFKPGIWIGEGKMEFTSTPEEIRYYTKWTASPQIDSQIVLKQAVEMHGVEDQVSNHLFVSVLSPTSFVMRIENELFGNVIGKGIVDDKRIAWEFRGTSEFEGYEVYELQENGDYLIHAEYTSTDGHRTTVQGRLWKKFEG